MAERWGERYLVERVGDVEVCTLNSQKMQQCRDGQLTRTPNVHFTSLDEFLWQDHRECTCHRFLLLALAKPSVCPSDILLYLVSSTRYSRLSDPNIWQSRQSHKAGEISFAREDSSSRQEFSISGTALLYRRVDWWTILAQRPSCRISHLPDTTEPRLAATNTLEIFGDLRERIGYSLPTRSTSKPAHLVRDVVQSVAGSRTPWRARTFRCVEYSLSSSSTAKSSFPFFTLPSDGL